MVGLFHYGNVYSIIPGNVTMSPLDFSSPDISSNAKLIADDIALYNETEIKDYPLTDLQPEEIKAVFAILNPGNVSKVLISISDEGLDDIKNKLSKEEFNNILNTLPNETKNIIEEKLNK
ncbi:MAG TPA: hypothetical protein VJ767_06575 [Nitrososphaeraceae archaeon]|nr:hypothetical protein [Nitrososphaeraceae archaeon]